VASRYVAGEDLATAVKVIRQLNQEGAMATVDLLGEEVDDRQRASAAVEAYKGILHAIAEERLDCNISVKPTQVGLKLDEGFCRENYTRLLEMAASQGNFVRLDMEDRHCTEPTLRLYHALHGRFGDRVGVVLQAYMRRTLADIAALPHDGANIRLCKGIYIEPRETAWKGYETVRLNFLAALEKLLSQGVYVGIATHDEMLICGAVALVDRLGIDRQRYEFQMLYGVEDRLRRILVKSGHRLRVYVPFGQEWYQYSIRRLRENPEVAGHVMRAFLRGG
jgi:proline dehydrogenase